ncbi:TPA: DUF1542 domain-containing protein [Streptococcus suis]
MNRSKKKTFDWYGMRQRFSIRKYHIGAASVLLGMTLVLSAGTIVSAETGVNGDGASNGQIVPGNGTGTSDGTQQQSDNQGNNSSGVQADNKTNPTANDQSAGDTGSASGLQVRTSRSADTGTQGDGSTNQPVDESVIKFPTQDNQTPPAGYQSVLFHSSYVKLDFEGKPGEIEITRNGKPIQVVAFWVKTGTTWGTLKKDPQFRIPKYTVDDGDFILGYDRSVGQVIRPTDFDSLDDTPIVDTWEFSPTVDYIVGDVSDGKTFEAYMNSGSYAPYQILQFHGITLNANGGTIDGKAKKAFYVAHEHVQWGNPRVTSKIDAASNKASRDGYTFVRWQTATGEGIPTSGQIETIEFTAVWLKHPTEAVAVFDSAKLTDSEKEQVKQNIYDANPDLSTGVPQIIKAIEISDTGEATVTFDDDTAVKVPSTTLTYEDKDTAKSNAKAKIEKEATEKSDDIKASNLTEEEKTARLNEVQDAQDRANIAIDNATTTEDFIKAISGGTAAIEAVSTTNSIKTKAKQALEEVYNAKKDEIDNSSLTAEEKEAKQVELDQAKSAANSAIDAATNDAGVTQALTAGKTAIAGIDTSTSAKKTQAKQDLDTAYNDKLQAIENSSLTDEEKATKQADLTTAKENAIKAVDDATDNAGVDTALEAGKAAIDAINTTTSAKKAQAKQDLDTAYNDKLQAIENSSLTDEEKATKQAELDKAKADADNAIDTATNNAGVDKALEDGKTAIATIDTTASTAKADAKKNLEETYNAKKAEIDNSALTAEEKVVKQAELDKVKEDAINAIDAATTGADVDTALNKGRADIEAIETLISAKKTDARQQLDEAYAAKEAEITNSSLTGEEKAAKLAELDKAKAAAENAIDTATNNGGVDKALEDGKSAIDSIDTTSSTAKADAKKDLEEAYNAKKAEIENSALTAEEKAAKQAELDKAKADADKAIDAATDKAGVDTALADGKATIGAIDTSASPKKATAKQDLEDAYNAKKDAITNSGLTAEEKAAKQVELDKAKTDADKAIDAATDNAGVAKALEDGKTAIAAIDTSASAEKAAAKKDLEEAYNAKKAEIENSALTADEKAAKQAELDKAKADADKAIDAATDNAGVARALEAGKTAIAAIDTSASAEKVAAKQDLEAAYNAKKDAITNSGLTAEEKAAKQAELDKAKADADKEIDATTDNAGVAKALEAGKTAIAAIDTTAGVDKATAKKDLEDAYNAKKAEIAGSALTADEKAAKQAELDKAKADADKAIDAATDKAGVDTALADGKTAIAAIDITAGVDKATAKKDLEDAYNAKKDAITNSGLTAEEKAAKQAELDKAKADADKAIDAATDNAGVAKALEAGKSAIDAVNTTTSAEKAAAKKKSVLPNTGDNIGLSSILGVSGLALLGIAIRKKREN